MWLYSSKNISWTLIFEFHLIFTGHEILFSFSFKNVKTLLTFQKGRTTIGSKKLLLLLSRFSRVRLCAIPQTAAHQAPPSLGFSRQEHWSGLPFPSPMHESEVAHSCPTPSDPMDCSPAGSSIHGIFQARVLERGAIAFFGPRTIICQPL